MARGPEDDLDLPAPAPRASSQSAMLTLDADITFKVPDGAQRLAFGGIHVAEPIADVPIELQPNP